MHSGEYSQQLQEDCLTLTYVGEVHEVMKEFLERRSQQCQHLGTEPLQLLLGGRALSGAWLGLVSRVSLL